MPVFGLFSNAAIKPWQVNKPQVEPARSQDLPVIVLDPPTDESSRSDASTVDQVAPQDIPSPDPSKDVATHAKLPKRSTSIRRFSFRTFSLAALPEDQHKPALFAQKDEVKKAHAVAAFSRRIIVRSLTTSSDKRAKESALIVRSLIIGPSASPASPKITMAVAMPQLGHVKSQLMQPKSANRLIVQLRALPASDGFEIDTDKQNATGPIHAVCLKHADAEEHARHFSRLESDATSVPKALDFSPMANASIETLTGLFSNIQVVSLIASPDLGLGQPGDGPGILAGAVPTAETVIRGVEEITPQLFALGYATGRTVFPDHTGVYPPTDRISVLTYWWGLELVLPPPSLEYLNNAQSVSGTIISFLTALAMINNGVREILPFVRYIAQFIDFEFNSIKRQNKGKGVVCAATWIMPAAMVPRPWDFPLPPPPKPTTVGNAAVPPGTVTPVGEANSIPPELGPSPGPKQSDPFPPALLQMPAPATASPEVANGLSGTSAKDKE